MRLKMISTVIWVLLLSQVASRPQQTEPERATSQVTKHPDEDARSRYRESHVASRNLNEFYNKLYNGGFTRGIMASLRQSFPRDIRNRENWSIYNQSSRLHPSITINKPLFSHRSKSPYHSDRKVAINNRAFIPFTKLKNLGRRATTKSPIAAKNRVVIKPSIFPSPTSITTKKHSTSFNTMKTVDKSSNSTTPSPSVSTPNLKTWPNTPPQSPQDLYNYEKYTTNDLEFTKNPVYPQSPQTVNPKPDNDDKMTEDPIITPSREPLIQPNIQEIIQWLQIPAFTTKVNQSYFMENLKPGQSISNTFSPIFNPNRPLVTTDIDPLIENYGDEGINDFYLPETIRPSEILSTTTEPVTLENSLSTLFNQVLTDSPVIPKRPIFRPFSEVSQNTVVHIINPMSKSPNVTVSEGQSYPNISTLKPPPNVHIMFMSQGNETQESMKDSVNQSPFQQNSNCPIITINSITKVNNTIQSKEGCTDLNIVINSQVLSTNNFDSGVLGFDEAGADKYADTSIPTDYSSTVYGTSPSVNYYSTPLEPDRNDIYDAAVEQEPSPVSESPNYDVNQETNIEYQSESDNETGYSEASEPVAQSEASDTVGPAEDAPVGGSLADRPVAPAAEEAFEQSSDAVGGPAAAGDTSAASGLNPAAGALGGSPASTALSALGSNNDDDDDDDDDFDLSLSGIMDGMTSLFTYFTFLNPLNYGIFSFAAAPFAALAAGILGLAAISFPYAFTGGFDFGRSADRVTVKFRPNLEEVVKQSIHDYRNWQEWKSKRRKRKR